jgi:hypothetical protein
VLFDAGLGERFRRPTANVFYGHDPVFWASLEPGVAWRLAGADGDYRRGQFGATNENNSSLIR